MLTKRDFLRSAALTGTSVVLTPSGTAWAQTWPRVIETYIGTGPEDAAELEEFEEGQGNA